MSNLCHYMQIVKYKTKVIWKIIKWSSKCYKKNNSFLCMAYENILFSSNAT